MAQTILIIDDDIDTLKLVGIMLERKGFRILASTTGNKGLQLAKDENPDLILLDIMIPDINGYEIARTVRSNSETESIPIIMFTARSQVDDKVEGLWPAPRRKMELHERDLDGMPPDQSLVGKEG
jgi:DNA-binding response OmpR family regulator